jgi:hypothetical protein
VPLSIFGHVSFVVFLFFQLNFIPSIFHPVNGLQDETQNQSSSPDYLEQEQQDDRALVLNESDSSRANPNELRLKEGTLTPELVASDLNSLNSSQFASYPLEELSSDDLLATFDIISDETLDKTLTNIRPENLKIIFDKILSLYYESIFERLSPETQKYVQESAGLQVIS